MCKRLARASRAVTVPPGRPEPCPKCYDPREWVVRGSGVVPLCLGCLRYDSEEEGDGHMAEEATTPYKLCLRMNRALDALDRAAGDFLRRYGVPVGQQPEPGPLMFAVRDVEWAQRMCWEMNGSLTRWDTLPDVPDEPAGPCVRKEVARA